MSADQNNKMSPTARWALGCGGFALLMLVVVLGAGVYIVSTSFVQSDEGVRELAQRITGGVTLPEGYEGQAGVDFSLFGMQVAAFSRSEKESIVIARIPEGAELDETGAAAANEEIAQTRTKVRDEELEVSGRTFEVGVYDVESELGAQREYSCRVAAEAGRLQFVFRGPVDGFDLEGMKTVLGSVD